MKLSIKYLSAVFGASILLTGCAFTVADEPRPDYLAKYSQYKQPLSPALQKQYELDIKRQALSDWDYNQQLERKLRAQEAWRRDWNASWERRAKINNDSMNDAMSFFRSRHERDVNVYLR